MNTPDQNSTNPNNAGQTPNPTPTPAPAVQPTVAPAAAPVVAAAAPAPAPAQGKWGRRFKTAGKVLGIGALCAGLGAAGYFGAQYYNNR